MMSVKGSYMILMANDTITALLKMSFLSNILLKLGCKWYISIVDA